MEIEGRFERIERTMEFLVQQQADMNGFLLRLAKFTEDFAHKTGERFERLEQAHERLEQAHERLEQSLERREEAGRRTDERLNALIAIVERHLENGGRRP